VLTLACLSAGFAETAPKRLLIIDSQTTEPYVPVREALVERLAELGYGTVGNTLELKIYTMGNNPDFVRRIEAQEGDRLREWDLIVVNGTIATIAAWNQWGHDPFVKVLFVAVTDPVGIGAVKAMNEPPDANFTGVSYPVPVEERLRIIRSVFPGAKKIGYVWGDMPQSVSYNAWLAAALRKPEFSDLELVSRKVTFVSGEFGTRRMSMTAAEMARGIDAQVDIFLTPNDQMGVLPDYNEMVCEKITKPLVGLTEAHIDGDTGAVMSVYPDTRGMGRQAAEMIAAYFGGAPFSSLAPRPPVFNVLFSGAAAAKHGVKIPDAYKDRVR